MKIKETFYTSYKTHVYCSKELKWIEKERCSGKYCPDCGWRVRRNPRFTDAKKERWAKAY